MHLRCWKSTWRACLASGLDSILLEEAEIFLVQFLYIITRPPILGAGICSSVAQAFLCAFAYGDRITVMLFDHCHPSSRPFVVRRDQLVGAFVAADRGAIHFVCDQDVSIEEAGIEFREREHHAIPIRGLYQDVCSHERPANLLPLRQARFG